MARKQPRLQCGVVVIAPLFKEKHRGAPAVRLDTDSNVSVCPIVGSGKTLHEVGLHIEAGFAAAGASDHQHILVPGRLGVFGPPGHGQAFGLGQQDVVFKLGVDVRGNVFGGAP